MTKLDYEPKRPPPQRPLARTLFYAAMTVAFIGLTFIMWTVIPAPGCELVCYSALAMLLAAGSALAAWSSYQED